MTVHRSFAVFTAWFSNSMENVFVSEHIMQFVSSMINSLRKNPSIVWGPSPRASISSINAGKALALLSERDHILPDDIFKYAKWILNHRIGLGPEYELEGVTTAEIVEKAVDAVDAV